MELSMKDAAEYVGVTYRTMKKYLLTKQITPSRQIGRNWLFTQAELDRFLATPRRRGGRPLKTQE